MTFLAAKAVCIDQSYVYRSLSNVIASRTKDLSFAACIGKAHNEFLYLVQIDLCLTFTTNEIWKTNEAKGKELNI